MGRFHVYARAVVLACALVLHAAPPTQGGQTLIIGTIDDEVKKTLNRFQALARYLGDHLKDNGVDAVEARILLSADEMIDALNTGHMDIYVDSPLIMALLARQTKLRPVLRRWKGGVAEYHSVFFTRSDSGLTTLDDLRGRTLAFEEPTSTSAYLLPKSMLLERGYQLQEMPSPKASVSGQSIGYVFSDDDDNTVYWVLKGKVHAGVTHSRNFAGFTAKLPGKLRRLGRSISVPRQVLSHRVGLDGALVDELTEVLLGMHETEQGRKVLKRFKTTRFDRFPDGADATMARIDRLLGPRPQPITN